jgi:hypothetical protein
MERQVARSGRAVPRSISYIDIKKVIQDNHSASQPRLQRSTQAGEFIMDSQEQWTLLHGDSYMKRALFLILPLVLISSLAALAATQSICWNSTTPSGWIKIDHYTSYTSCGNGTSIYTVNNNVKVIESYYDKPVGSTMAVCALEPTPSGWQVVYYETSSQCYIK